MLKIYSNEHCAVQSSSILFFQWCFNSTSFHCPQEGLQLLWSFRWTEVVRLYDFICCKSRKIYFSKYHQRSDWESKPYSPRHVGWQASVIARPNKACQSCLFASQDGVTGYTCFEPTFSTVTVQSKMGVTSPVFDQFSKTFLYSDQLGKA